MLVDTEAHDFSELMVVNTLRGWQGAGVAMVNTATQSPIMICRSRFTATDLVLSQQYETFLKKGTKRLLAGHCRWPTKGNQTIENIHPHSFEHITLTHNGTMHYINGKYFIDYKADGKSDTAILCEEIAQHGIQSVMRKSRGAWSLVVLNAKDKTISFLRNKERPLYFAWPSKGVRTTMFWSSEELQLQLVLGKRYPQLHIEELPENILHVFKIGECRPEMTEEVKGEEIVYTNTSWRSNARPSHGVVFGLVPDDFEDQDDWDWWVHNGQKPQTGVTASNTPQDVDPELPWEQQEAKKKGQSVVPFRQKESKPSISAVRDIVNNTTSGTKDTYDIDNQTNAQYFPTKGNYVVSHRDLTRFLHRGCCVCSDPGDWLSYVAKEYHWVSYNEFVCKECENDDGNRELLRNQFPNAYLS